jgi:hypothetical protein
MAADRLVLHDARQHNLRGITVEIPRRALTVVTGPSGSGKSSLAFDTLYAEGQRRYVESLSTYAKQFLERMAKPDVGARRAVARVAIEQKNPTTSAGPRLAATEIYDYLRLLWPASASRMPNRRGGGGDSPSTATARCGTRSRTGTPPRILWRSPGIPGSFWRTFRLGSAGSDGRPVGAGARGKAAGWPPAWIRLESCGSTRSRRACGSTPLT